MKLRNKLFTTLLVIIGFSNLSFSAPGDTTTVTVFQNLDINHYGAFDTSVVLPPATQNFQKVRLLYTLGRRSCPGEQYCGSWDYTTSVYAKSSASNGDSLELMRVITPYASDWPLSRTFTYAEEVTDYTSLLHDDVDFTYFYEGYSWGFTLTLEVEMIEGEAPRKAVSVENIYDGHYKYGVTADPIENHLSDQTKIYSAPATTARIKNTISGHGSDNTGCSEFCSKWYRQKIDGNQIAQQQLWKSDCGLNELYPQTGTWLFDRANWCPGEQVFPIYHDLSSSTTAGTNFNANMDMQPYTSSGGATYYITSQLIAYEDPTYQLDAAITGIIAPNMNENFNRYNPVCSHPVIKIRNEGADNLTSLKIAYRLQGGQNAYYDWTGNLGFMEEEEVDLGSGLQVFNENTAEVFIAEIVEINGQSSDATDWNNNYRAAFESVPEYPSNFEVFFRTNGSVDPQNAPYNETSWKVLDEDGNVVASRTNNQTNTTYRDTLQLADGCYTFVMDDAGCDGIAWWFYPNYNSNPGNGTLKFLKSGGAGTLKTFNGDFGCQIKERFTVGYKLSTQNINPYELDFKLYPNPAKDEINLAFSSNIQSLSYAIFDVQGNTIQDKNIVMEGNELNINIQTLDKGMYFIRCANGEHQSLIKKFLIQ